MLQQSHPCDYLIASGRTTSLKEFVNCAFEAAGLAADNHVESVDTFMRPADLRYSAMDPSRIKSELGWSSSKTVKSIVQKMYAQELF
jgi:GDPmannose 4,6-dehydratase